MKAETNRSKMRRSFFSRILYCSYEEIQPEMSTSVLRACLGMFIPVFFVYSQNFESRVQPVISTDQTHQKHDHILAIC